MFTIDNPGAAFGYADPPYPGQALRHYGEHPDYAGEVDHVALIAHLEHTYDGWALHSSSVALRDVLPLVPDDARLCVWVKPWCAFKRNVSVAYAWEPVFIKAIRKPRVTGREVMRDWVDVPIATQRGLSGVKPERVCRWVFELAGAHYSDVLFDLFPGSGAVADAWRNWGGKTVRSGGKQQITV